MKIGILGGGQLARMIIEQTAKYGFQYKIFSEFPESPAGLICSEEITGSIRDNNLLDKFIAGCDVITLENEFIDIEILKYIVSKGAVLLPHPSTVELIQDKLLQKNFLAEQGIPVAEYAEVKSKSDIKEFASKYGYPVILKSRTMGYDGKGNFKISNEKDIDEGYDLLIKRGKLYCERYIDFRRELAIQVVRSKTGEISYYPVVESIQENHICKIIKASGLFNKEISEFVNKLAGKIVESLDYAGVMGIEMFQMTDGSILVNELAPRVHNSGHYTMEVCYVSQFENHIRAIAGMPLGSTDMKCDNAVMVNILGGRNGEAKVEKKEEILKDKNAHLHIYGKKETRTGRKMGHITLTGDDMSNLLYRANKYDTLLKI